jgi:hypothetical protein
MAHFNNLKFVLLKQQQKFKTTFLNYNWFFKLKLFVRIVKHQFC